MVERDKIGGNCINVACISTKALVESARASETILEHDRLPACLSILGGGYVGCEFASMFALFGSHVTLVQGRDQSRWTTTRASAP